MSGIYIPGMKMPTRGEYRCVVRTWGEEVTIDLYGDEELRGVVIPVPDHGRLIDANALTKIIIDQENNEYNIKHQPRNWAKAMCAFEEIVVDAPTIIQADEAPTC